MPQALVWMSDYTFGSAPNLNPHLHMLFVDGTCAFDVEAPRFHRVAAPTQAGLKRLLRTIAIPDSHSS